MKKISRRDMLKQMAWLAAGGVLAACTPATPEVEETAPVEQPIVGAEMEGKLIWDTFRAPGTGWNEERISTFKDEFPNVEIEFRPLGGGQQENYAKMYAMHAAGDLGDIIAFDPSHYHFWRAIDKDIIMPLDNFIEGDQLDLSKWFSMFIELQRYKGQIYGLPSWGWTGYDSLVTNKVHFDAEGIELPDPTSHDTSMETIAEWAHRFYKEGERYGLAVSLGEAFLPVLCRCFNSYFINEEGTKCLILEDENAQNALKWAYELAVEDKVLPAVGEIQGGYPAAQLEGRVTMNWAGSLNVRNFKRDIKDAEVAEAWQVLFPTREDGKYPSQIRGGTWNIRKGTEYPEAAYEFLKHITSKEGCFGFNLVAGQGALVRPDVVELLIATDSVHEWFIPNLENGIPARAPANSRGREYTDAVAQWSTILMDKNNPIPFEKGLEDLYENVQEILDQPPP